MMGCYFGGVSAGFSGASDGGVRLGWLVVGWMKIVGRQWE